MLNYVWAGLVILSIVFALGHDLQDEWADTYHNGTPIQLSYTKSDTSGSIELRYRDQSIEARMSALENIREITIVVNKNLPALWQKIAKHQSSKDKTTLHARVISKDSSTKQLILLLPEVHWIKIRAISQAAFDMAEFAVKLAIGLAGIMALWLGLMQIAEKSGLILVFVKLLRPLLRWLFPDIPKDHPALGGISLNLAANVLGLGNAATPLGIKAMQQLQTLNTKKDTASDAMCMFLALNTSSVQLLPPVTLIALMGTQVSELIIPIILATTASTIVAVTAAKLYVRLGR